MQTRDLPQSRRLFARTTWRTLFFAALLASLVSTYGCSTVTSHKTTSASGASATGTTSPLATITASPNSATAVPTNSATAVPTAPSNTAPPTLQTQIITNTYGAIPGQSVSPAIYIQCPAGYLAVGGGLDNASYGYYYATLLMANAPVDTTTWVTQIYNGDSAILTSPKVSVVCLKATGTTLNAQIVNQSLGVIQPGSGSPVVEAVCPAGYVASGGGFIGAASHAFSIMTNAPTPGNPAIWLAQAYNTGSNPFELRVQIICLSAPNLQRQIIQVELQSSGSSFILPDTFGFLAGSPRCPYGTVISDGGLDSGYPNIFETEDFPYSTFDWSESVYNRGNLNAIAQVNLTCLSFG